jgi:hypothetical protein
VSRTCNGVKGGTALTLTGHEPEASPDWMPSVLGALLLVNLGFFAINIASFVLLGRVLEFLYVDVESSLPTWWSSTQLLLAGLLVGLVAVRNIAVRKSVFTLGLLALVLILLSIDEMSMLHERVGIYLDRFLGDRRVTRFDITGLWFVVIGVPFAVLVVLMLRLLSAFLAEVPGTRIRLLLGFAVLLSGAVGVEALTNFVVDVEMIPKRAEIGRYVLLAGLEELLEMSGGSLLLWASLGLVLNHWSTRAILGQVRPLTADEAATLAPADARLRASAARAAGMES